MTEEEISERTLTGGKKCRAKEDRSIAARKKTRSKGRWTNTNAKEKG